MFKGKRILAIIPARSGSKGIKGKNIRPIGGKPLIYWTISEAQKSAYIDRVIVSTDSSAIARVSKKYKADVPFLRPKHLSGDTASSIDVVLHAVKFMKDKGGSYDVFVLLQPTSPLRKSSDIDGAIKKLFDKKAGTVVSVTEESHPPFWINTLPSDGCMKNFLPSDVAAKGRQAFKQYYSLNGAVFTGFVGQLNQTKSFYCDKTFAYIMPRDRSVDIDDMTDFAVAELFLKERIK